MIVLASTSDLLQIVTREAVTVDVQADWVDGVATATPGRTNTLISTATTTTVVAAPAGGVYRTIKTVHIRNRSATAAVKVTVVHTDGTTAVEMHACTIKPSGSLDYDERRGWTMRRTSGSVQWQTVGGQRSLTVGELGTAVLAEDAQVANATAGRLRDVMDLGIPVLEGERYWVRFQLMFTAAATTTGSRITLYGPGSVTAIRTRTDVSTGTGTRFGFEGQAGYDLSTTVNSSAATGSNIATIEGFIDVPTCDGIVYLRIGSEVAASAITVKAGSTVQWQRVT